MLEAPEGGLFAGRTLGLFECKVPEQDCNIQLGSRRKSVDPTKTEFLFMNSFDRDSLIIGVTALAIHQLQNGRPDALLVPEIYLKISEICKKIADQLLSTGKATIFRADVAVTCNKVLDRSKLPVATSASPGPRVESFTSTSMGTCNSQEDRAIRVGRLANACGLDMGYNVDHLVAVYDGHGGPQCSEFAVERIFYEIGSHKGSLDEAIRDSYSKVDSMFAEAALKEDINAGCTALTCVLRENELWCGNVGDSRAIICRKENGEYNVKQLTTDHNVKNAEEVNAVIERGGTILRNRVNGVLCVTRALGNKPCRELIGQVPDIVKYDVDYEKDQFLILGSDGLYDKVTNQELADFVIRKRGELDERLRGLREELSGTAAQEDQEALAMLGFADETPAISKEQAEQFLQCSYQIIADELVEYVVSRSSGYCDNTTCVVLFFDCENALTAEEIALSSAVLNEQLMKEVECDRTGTPDIVMTPVNESDDFDPMETSMMTRPV